MNSERGQLNHLRQKLFKLESFASYILYFQGSNISKLGQKVNVWLSSQSKENDFWRIKYVPKVLYLTQISDVNASQIFQPSEVIQIPNVIDFEIL